jgi:tRNA(Glu) U13 pseudouridine synthase TruD
LTISRREVGYNERDLSIAIGLGAGLTAEQIANSLGVDRSTIFNRKAANRDFIEMVSAKVKAACASNIARATEDIKARYERMYSKAVTNLEEFLEDEDPEFKWRATIRTIDGKEGKPTQRIKQEIESHHVEEHRVSLPQEELSELLALVGGQRRLLAPVPIQAVKVEPSADSLEPELIESE